MAAQPRPWSFLRQRAFELALVATVVLFGIVVRPPIDVAAGGGLQTLVMGLAAVLVMVVPGALLLARYATPRYWIRWAVVAVAALLALVPVLWIYFDQRARYSVDFEGHRVVVGDDGDLTDDGKLYRQVEPSAAAASLVRRVAGQTGDVWRPEALRARARTFERFYLLGAALAGLTAIALAGSWRSRGRPRPLESLAVRTPEPTPAGAASGRRFRVALSFPGEVRDRAEAIATSLEPVLGRDRIFFDRWYAAELARPNMDLHLQEIYRHQSDLLVVMLCAEYERKEWCGLEWRVVRELVKEQAADRIMLLRLDDTPIEGLLSIDGYLAIADMEDSAVAEAVLSRVTAGGTNRPAPV